MQPQEETNLPPNHPSLRQRKSSPASAIETCASMTTAAQVQDSYRWTQAFLGRQDLKGPESPRFSNYLPRGEQRRWEIGSFQTLLGDWTGRRFFSFHEAVWYINCSLPQGREWEHGDQGFESDPIVVALHTLLSTHLRKPMLDVSEEDEGVLIKSICDMLLDAQNPIHLQISPPDPGDGMVWVHLGSSHQDHPSASANFYPGEFLDQSSLSVLEGIKEAAEEYVEAQEVLDACESVLSDAFRYAEPSCELARDIISDLDETDPSCILDDIDGALSRSVQII